METTLLILCAVVFFFACRIVYKSDKHYRWFKTLKPGDRVLVRIYSINCNCEAKATITSEANGKYINALIDSKDYKHCETCAHLNGDGNNGVNTCWYNITKFNKGNVAKLEE